MKSNLFVVNFYPMPEKYVSHLLDGTEQEILTSLKSASMQERKQHFALTSTTIPTFPETLNYLFSRSLSSQKKYGSN